MGSLSIIISESFFILKFLLIFFFIISEYVSPLPKVLRKHSRNFPVTRVRSVFGFLNNYTLC